MYTKYYLPNQISTKFLLANIIIFSFINEMNRIGVFIYMVEKQEMECLVSALKKCKQSSKEAVENLSLFSDFKEYMHVQRPVEIELERLINSAHDSITSQLILVCGGVGDGKSHIMSYLKKRLSFLNDDNEFYLHNDATESFEPQKTSIQTLAEVLSGFSDEGLRRGNTKKIILAINLGALNNFIDSDEGEEFTDLRNYVIKEGILDSTISNNDFDSQSVFQYINFSDYHMFQLTSEGPKSDYIKEIFRNVSQNKSGNGFYESYIKNCKTGCPAASKCPIKQNFELFQNESIQDKIIELLIQAIVKEKLIISTRALLNFIHDLIVPSIFESAPDLQVINNIIKQPFNEYVSCLLPMLLFEKSDISPINRALYNISPLKQRTEALDNHYIKFRSREDGADMFVENINIDMLPYLSSELKHNSPWTNVSKSNNEEFKERLVKLFVYLYYLIPKNEHKYFDDGDYVQFMKYLFYWNIEDTSKLSKLYKEEVRDAIYKWNGEGSGDMIYVQIGQAQTQYRSLQRLEIEPSITQQTPKLKSELFKFLPFMTLVYKPKGNLHQDESNVKIELDYSLYCLLVRIRNGYRPNKKDKLEFIKFVEFVERLSNYGYQKEEIIFERKHSSKTIMFTLKYDSMFNQYSFSERS